MSSDRMYSYSMKERLLNVSVCVCERDVCVSKRDDNDGGEIDWDEMETD